MLELTINGKPVTVAEGTTVLEAAERLGVNIPTLCHLKGTRPYTSCMVCIVKDLATGRQFPACSAPATAGMKVDTESAGIRLERAKVLELLLSEHVGDCEAPCRLTCPARMDIPLMIRQIAAGQIKEAYATVTDMIALPAVLGRICPAPCEKACRRGRRDKPVSICLLKRFTADSAGLVTEPVKGPATGKSVAIIGAGPAGLAAAYYLARAGHACTVFDEHDAPGGQLRYQVPRDQLPLDALEQDIAGVRRLGVTFTLNTRIDPVADWSRLKAQFDAIVLAAGRSSQVWPVESGARGVKAAPGTFQTSDPAVFAGGEVVQEGHMAVRAAGHGKSIAVAVDQWLRGESVTGQEKTYESRLGKLMDGELETMMMEAVADDRIEPRGGLATGFTEAEAVQESRRCLHCDCRKSHTCVLRDLATAYGAGRGKYSIGSRGSFTKVVSALVPGNLLGDSALQAPCSLLDQVVYESGKCIKCGICVRIAEWHGVGAGLTFLGRGFETVVGAPFGDSLETALGPAVADCIRECPTGALAPMIRVVSRS